jgi:long-subunit fatty acid transport protein
MSPRLAILSAALLLGPSLARAQNNVLTRIGSGARAAGMANAFVAISDDGTAASWNPGALAQLRKPELSLVASSLGADFQVDGLHSVDDRFVYAPRRFDYSTTSLEFASLAVPFNLFKKPVTLQASWRRLYQLSAQFTDETTREPATPDGDTQPVLLRRNQSLKGHVDLLSLAGSVRLTRRLLVGGNLDFVRGDWDVDFTQLETPGTHAASDFVAASQTNKLRGEGGTLGILLTYPSVNVGLVYHFPLWMDYDIDQAIHSNLGASATLHTDPGTRMRFPTSFAAGVAWRPSSEWTLAADATFDDWSRTTVDRYPEHAVPTNFFDDLPEDRTSTRDTVTLAAGAERLFRGEGHVVPLRFGIAYEPQGAMDPVTRDPVNVLVLAAGGGFNTNQVKLDAAFELRRARYAVVEELGVRGALTGAETALGITSQREWRLKLSLIYRITDTDKLRSLAKRVFVGP